MMRNIYENGRAFAASQYGALYFNRVSSSRIISETDAFDGEGYNVTSLDKCLSSDFIYRLRDQCFNYQGVSYIVSTNFTALHAPLLYQAIADQALINEVVDDVTISVTINPLPLTNHESNYIDSANAFTAWIILIFSFPFITG